MTMPYSVRVCLAGLSITMLLAASEAFAQRAGPAPSSDDLVAEFRSHAADRHRLDSLWEALQVRGNVPFVTPSGDVVFLYRGEADSVFVVGDHTNWQTGAHSALQRLAGTDVWWLRYDLPVDALLSYKLVVDGDWILDPGNDRVQWSGFGPNSELRMPAWHAAPETVRHPDRPAGRLLEKALFRSRHTGMAHGYRVYVPHGYDDLADLPVIYATDGHEYIDDRLGAAVIVLDNLIFEKRIEPAIAVFIDPRVNDTNLRTDLYIGNPDFARFVADELVPRIDDDYRTRQNPDARLILGTSFGGLFAAYLGARHHDVFSRLAVQSPAFWPAADDDWSAQGSIFDLVATAPPGTLVVHMTAGTIFDGLDLTRQMRDILAEHGHVITCHEVNEGHSWGNWRARLPDVFETLLPPR